MKQEIEKPLDEQRRIVAYLDGLQAKVNVLRPHKVPEGSEWAGDCGLLLMIDILILFKNGAIGFVNSH